MRNLIDWGRAYGVDLIRAVRSLHATPGFFRDLLALHRQLQVAARPMPWGRLYPCLTDKHATSGTIDGHYFQQDLLVAQRIHRSHPMRHVDVGSRVDGFVAHVAAFREIEVFDIRPIYKEVPNIIFRQADFMGELDEKFVEYCDSVSCLHALEHFGLGRYGDPIRYDGYLLGLNNLFKVLAHGGTLYLSLPIGPERIEFNAHRVLSLDHLMSLFGQKWKVKSFSCIDDKGRLFTDVPLSAESVGSNFGCNYGCGIFELLKE